MTLVSGVALMFTTARVVPRAIETGTEILQVPKRIQASSGLKQPSSRQNHRRPKFTGIASEQLILQDGSQDGKFSEPAER